MSACASLRLRRLDLGQIHWSPLLPCPHSTLHIRCLRPSLQERRFKNQFVAHARGELERTVRHCSSYCSQGVERDLRSQMDELFAHLEKTQSQLERDIATYDEELVILQRAAKDSERVRLQGRSLSAAPSS